MDLVSPSKEWTKEDRERVVFAILQEMQDEALKKSLIRSSKVLAWRERISLVLNMPASFLEINRETILKGHLVDRDKAA